MKNVIVTGASKGIGAAICTSLRTKGVRVIGVARSKELLEEASMQKIGSGPMEFCCGDIADREVQKRSIEMAVKDGGTLDALILNASVMGPVQNIADLDVEEVAASLQKNTISTLAWLKLAIPHLRKSKGNVICTSSAVSTMPYSGMTAYTLAKANLNTIMSILAKEEPSITCLALSPGIVATEMQTDFYEQGKHFMNQNERAFMENLKTKGGLLDASVVGEAFANIALSAPKSQSGKYCNWDDEWVNKLPKE